MKKENGEMKSLQVKFFPGDTVFFMYENKIHESRVTSVEASLFTDGSGTPNYRIDGFERKMYEMGLFSTAAMLCEDLVCEVKVVYGD